MSHSLSALQGASSVAVPSVASSARSQRIDDIVPRTDLDAKLFCTIASILKYACVPRNEREAPGVLT